MEDLHKEMCGIVGFYNLKSENSANIELMLREIAHRGPDANGVWNDGRVEGVVIGHTRLSIQDLTETGSQPMISHSRRYVIAYNGEIYNSRDLLNRMRASGYTDHMRGTSDTEILLEACGYYGVEETLIAAKGMFAFALYDRDTHDLILARDRIGEKPMYYGFAGDAFVFASELGAIRKVDGFSAEINREILPVYMKYGYIPAPYSIYRNVWKLMPGTILKIKCELNKYRGFETSEYWKITDVAIRGQQNLFKGSRKEAADELERLFKNSVRGQMISDVPLGAFLSAGIDSSTVVSVMQSVSETPVRTFTIGFEDREYDESAVAGEIASRLGTMHTRLTATEQEAMEAIPLMPRIFGEPFGDSSQIPTYLVSRLTKEHVTVSLSGDGGDELFAGYRDYAGVYSIYNKIHNIPLWIRKGAGALMRNLPGDGENSRRIRAHGALLPAENCADLYLRTYETWDGLDKLMCSRDGSADTSCVGRTVPATHFDPVHTAMLLNMQMYHPDDILVKVDRTAMAVSLETRVPMLDRDIVEFAWTLPLEYIFDGTVGKLVLRDVLYRYVDRELMDRPKKGFGVPVARWIRDGKLREWAEELFNPNLINTQGLLDTKETVRLWKDYINRNIWRPQIWYILMLNSWMKSEMSL